MSKPDDFQLGTRNYRVKFLPCGRLSYLIYTAVRVPKVPYLIYTCRFENSAYPIVGVNVIYIQLETAYSSSHVLYFTSTIRAKSYISYQNMRCRKSKDGVGTYCRIPQIPTSSNHLHLADSYRASSQNPVYLKAVFMAHLGIFVITHFAHVVSHTSSASVLDPNIFMTAVARNSKQLRYGQ